MEKIVQRVGRSLSNTPLHRPAVAVYNGVAWITENSPLTDILNYWYIGRRGPLVQVKASDVNFDPFLIRLESAGKLQRQRARGVYEPHVMSFLDNELTSESVFWELGAAWGYFSIAAATRVTQVCSFEMVAERVRYLEEAIEANELDNIVTIDEKLGSDTDFTKYPKPDVVLVDIEGWEFPVLSTALEQYPDVPTWIVEVHSELKGIETADPVGEIERLFENKGYDTSALNAWSENNIHLVARK